MGKIFPENWGNREKSLMGANSANQIKQMQQIEGRPAWLDMVMIKRYPRFTRYMKLCPNGECWYECFLNTEIDAYKQKRGMK